MNRLRLLFVVALALIAGIVIGWRAHIAYGREVDTRPIPSDVAFTPFPTYAPTLPTSCCRPDDEPEPPTISAPGPGLAPVVDSSADNGDVSPPRTVVRAVRGFQLRHVKASWHDTGRDGAYAAACRPLRKAIGPDWRGQRVLVAFKRRAIEVKLNDFCRSRDKTIDLSDEAFRFLCRRCDIRSVGVIRVAIGGFR